MKIAVVGGTGQVGSEVAAQIEGLGHEAVIVSRSAGVDVASGSGLAAALSGVDAVIDVSNTSAQDPQGILDFFSSAGRNIGETAAAAGVRNVVLLSIIGIDEAHGYPHFAGKAAQERALAASGAPYTVLRAAQFFEFAADVAGWGDTGDHSDVPPLLMQPVSIRETAAYLIELALGEPVGGVVEIAGPDRVDLVDAARRTLAARGEERTLVPSWRESGFGVEMAGDLLLPNPGARIASDRFADWLAAGAKPTAR